MCNSSGGSIRFKSVVYGSEDQSHGDYGQVNERKGLRVTKEIIRSMSCYIFQEVCV